jgi:hypothetical protein
MNLKVLLMIINRLSNECKQGVKNERFVMKRFLNV